MANTAERRSATLTTNEVELAAAEGVERLRGTELGRRLIAARAAYLAEHGRFLTQDEFDRAWVRERDSDRDDEE
jgi:hypothetical protein